MKQSVPELNLFSTADSAINKNPNLKYLWNVDAIGICHPAHLNDNDKALEQCKQFVMMENAIKLLGHGRLVNLISLLLLMGE